MLLNMQSTNIFFNYTLCIAQKKSISTQRPLLWSGCNVDERGKNININMHEWKLTIFMLLATFFICQRLDIWSCGLGLVLSSPSYTLPPIFDPSNSVNTKPKTWRHLRKHNQWQVWGRKGIQKIQWKFHLSWIGHCIYGFRNDWKIGMQIRGSGQWWRKSNLLTSLPIDFSIKKCKQSPHLACQGNCLHQVQL